MTSGFVYFIQAKNGGPVKIGYSRSPESRMRALQTAHHQPLVLLRVVPGNVVDEALLHEHLAAFRMSGEWFADATEVLTFTEDGVDLPTMRPAPAPKRGDSIERLLRTVIASNSVALVAYLDGDLAGTCAELESLPGLMRETIEELERELRA